MIFLMANLKRDNQSQYASKLYLKHFHIEQNTQDNNSFVGTHFYNKLLVESLTDFNNNNNHRIYNNNNTRTKHKESYFDLRISFW